MHSVTGYYPVDLHQEVFGGDAGRRLRG